LIFLIMGRVIGRKGVIAASLTFFVKRGNPEMTVERSLKAAATYGTVEL
jgi:hypothetical protein